MSLQQEPALGGALRLLWGQSWRKTAPSSTPCSPCPPGLRVGTGAVRTWVLGWVLPVWRSAPVFPQGVAVLGIALIAMGEEIGAEMALRTFGHLVSDAGETAWSQEGTWEQSLGCASHLCKPCCPWSDTGRC